MNANLFTKKIEMSKSEAKEDGKLNTEKFHELRQFMAAYSFFVYFLIICRLLLVSCARGECC